MKKEAIILGMGGQSKSIIDTLEANKFPIYGVIDIENKKLKNFFMGYNVIGNLNIIKKLSKNNYNFYIAIGDNKKRKIFFNKVRLHKLNFPTLIHPTTVVSKRAKIKKGSFLAAGCIINVDVVINEFSIINTGSVLDHEVHLGSFGQVCTGVKIGGRVKIGNECFIGIGSTIIDNVIISSNIIVGGGSTVIKSIKSKGVYVGSPVRQVKQTTKFNNKY